MRSADEFKTRRARDLRGVENEAEAKLWTALRARRLNGFKFVRQFPIGPYFADFACRELRLVVEADGSQHARDGADEARNRYMREEGWSVLRFWNGTIFSEKDNVLNTIRMACEGQLQETHAFDLTYLPAFQPKDRR